MLKKLKKKLPEDSVWTRELIPEDSVWRKELIPEDSLFRKDLLAFAKRKSPCLQCPILMLAEERRCNRYNEIPQNIWDGLDICPLYEQRTG